MPHVTIILSTYNYSSLLPYSIGSVLQQTYTDFELLVIGDGCTDDSEKVVSDIPDGRVRWINLAENTGCQSGPNNEGLRQADGDIIAYLSHDDLWIPNHLELMVRAIDAGNDFVNGVALWVHPNGKKALQFYRFPQDCVIPPSSFVHKRVVGEQTGGWRDYRETERLIDVDFLHRAYDEGFRFQWVARITVVKFLAAQRRNIYRSRPCHEQSEWLTRIDGNPNFGDIEAIKMMDELLSDEHKPFKLFLMDFLKGITIRIKARIHGAIRRIKGSIREEVEYSAQERYERKRKFKGL